MIYKVTFLAETMGQKRPIWHQNSLCDLESGVKDILTWSVLRLLPPTALNPTFRSGDIMLPNYCEYSSAIVTFKIVHSHQKPIYVLLLLLLLIWFNFTFWFRQLGADRPLFEHSNIFCDLKLIKVTETHLLFLRLLKMCLWNSINNSNAEKSTHRHKRRSEHTKD